MNVEASMNGPLPKPPRREQVLAIWKILALFELVVIIVLVVSMFNAWDCACSATSTYNYNTTIVGNLTNITGGMF